MKNLRHPNFILAIISAIILFIGVVLRYDGFQTGDYVIGLGALLAGIHWIWAIVDVLNRKDIQGYQRMFWFIIVVGVPVFGGMVFYGLHQERGKIVT